MKKLSVLVFSVLLVFSMILGAACAKAASSGSYYVNEAKDEAVLAETSAAYPYAPAYSAKSDSYAYDYPADEPEVLYEQEVEEAAEIPMPAATSADEPAEELPGYRDTNKLIYTCDLTIQTTEFEKTVKTIHSLIDQFGGFIASETRNDSDTAWYRSGYVKTSASLSEVLTVRIPAGHYHEFLNALDGNGKILSKNMNVENISRQYSETETTIKSLETQEERLLAMMEQCETVEDMITVEARLSEVQNELKIYRNRLSSMDTDVAYSTITMRINEVLEYTPDKEPVKVQTFGDRLKNTLKETGRGFLSFLEGLLFFIINAIPYLLILAVIALLIIWLVKRNRKKNAGKAPVPPVRQIQKKPAAEDSPYRESLKPRESGAGSLDQRSRADDENTSSGKTE